METGGKERGKSGKSSSRRGDLMARVLEKGLSQSQPPSEMLPYMMLEQQQAKSKKKKKSKDDGRSDSWSAPGGSSSSEDTDDDDEDLRESSGMTAVANLNRMHKRVKRHLGGIRTRSGGGDGCDRRPILDLERLVEAPAVGQNSKGSTGARSAGAEFEGRDSKAGIQSMIQGGDWSSAWLLTGIPDPLLGRSSEGPRRSWLWFPAISML